ncbi:MAG: transglycosylase SLT domain-containing protein [Thiohalospira sp.]
MKIQLLLLYFTISGFVFAPENPEFQIYLKKNVEQEKIKQKKALRINNLLAALRTIESNNTYNAKGSSGEYGAYQFMPETWDIYCYMFFGKQLDITNPKNQDIIAYKKIENLINKGYSNSEIAATWNSGNAQNWQSKIGVNSYGISYNVPAYVDNFLTIYYNQKYAT